MGPARRPTARSRHRQPRSPRRSSASGSTASARASPARTAPSPATPYYQCVAVSQTDDATGAYNLYAFNYGSVFPDYPKMGVWPDAYYITFNMFNGNTFAGAKACAYDRNAMLAGTTATQQCFQLS